MFSNFYIELNFFYELHEQEFVTSWKECIEILAFQLKLEQQYFSIINKHECIKKEWRVKVQEGLLIFTASNQVNKTTVS